MNKSVLISIKPYYIFLLIANKMGWDIPQEKMIEIRKNYPKDKTWNKIVHIYCTKDKKSFSRIPAQYQPLMRKFIGRVIGRFICNEIYKWNYDYSDGVDIDDDLIIDTCQDREDINIYAKGKTLYGWHISELKIYGKPKLLRSFYKPCPIKWENCPCCEFYSEYTGCCVNCIKQQSKNWCYVENL